MDLLWDHYDSIHMFQCDNCFSSFDSLAALQKHELVHLPSSPPPSSIINIGSNENQKTQSMSTAVLSQVTAVLSKKQELEEFAKCMRIIGEKAVKEREEKRARQNAANVECICGKAEKETTHPTGVQHANPSIQTPYEYP